MYLQLLLLITLTFTTLQSITLHQAIEKSDVETVKTILIFSNLTSEQKTSFLDLAQNIINKRRDRYMFFVPELIGGTFGLYIFFNGTMMYLNSLENRRNYFGLHFTALGAVILAILTARHNYQAKYCDDAVTIKQLIYEA